MTVYTPTADPSQLTQLRADADQLVHPIPVPIRQRTRQPGGHRSTAWTITDHPCLLDQLRNTARRHGAATHGPQRRTVPTSRPPVNLDAIDALATIYVGLAGWHTALRLPSPPKDVDWQKTTLRQLAADARHRPPDLVTALAADVHHWWRLAATHSGWSTTELLTLR